MSTFFNKVKRTYRLLKAYRKQRLPQGLAEFHAFTDDVIDLYGMPNNDSIKYVIATMILNLKSQEAFVSKRSFGLMLYRAAANQVASQVFQDIQAAHKAELAKQQAEAIAHTNVVALNAEQK